ncbi:hypothetical protein GCM10009853_032150 [Glycomyces scopariae]
MTDDAAADVVLRYDTVYETIDDPKTLEECFDDDAGMRTPAGTYGIRYWLGKRDSEDEDHPMREPVLRVDLDPESGAGALRWLPDDLIGVEDDYTPAVVTVAEDFGQPLVWVPAAEARVSYTAARTAALRYAQTRRRPDTVTWIETTPDATPST